jgi:ribonuclease HI
MDNIVEDAINIFTDGSSYSGPRKGGMGILFVVINIDGHEESFEHVPQGHKGANNQQMELQACVEAFDHLLSKYSPVSLSDYRKVTGRSWRNMLIYNIDIKDPTKGANWCLGEAP